ncbi:MAG TPA: hypothetical protein VFR34_00980, partial [Paracoccaceae bacterium]|nr:hypothetical protein [Paracoccaceae bacterium]
MAFWPFSRRPSGGPKLCILHSGMPKTGSSALQRYLARNAGKLRRHGILYARAGRGMFRGVEHGDLMRSISERPLYANTGHLPAELDRELRRTAHDVLLISSEYLYSPLYFNRNQKIQTFFRERGYEIHSVLYIRDQPDFVNSAYAQMVKTLHEPGSFEHFLELRLRRDPPPAGRRLRLDHL